MYVYVCGSVKEWGAVVGLRSILRLDEKSYWLTTWQSFTVTCAFDGTHAARRRPQWPCTDAEGRAHDNVLLFVPRFVGSSRRRGVGLGGVDNVRVGAEERGCVRTASLCRIFLCLASSSFHIDFCIYLRKKKGKMLSKSLFKLKQQIWCFLKKHLKRKKKKKKMNAKYWQIKQVFVTVGTKCRVSFWYFWSSQSDMQQIPKKEKENRTFWLRAPLCPI